MDSESNPLDGDLAAFEQRLKHWDPASGSLDRDRVLFEAGRASALARAGRGPWVVLSVGTTAATLLFGTLFVHERGQRRMLALALADARQEVRDVKEERSPIAPLDDRARPGAENEYLALRNRVLAQGLDAWPVAVSREPEGAARETPRDLLTPSGSLRFFDDLREL